MDIVSVLVGILISSIFWFLLMVAFFAGKSAQKQVEVSTQHQEQVQRVKKELGKRDD